MIERPEVLKEPKWLERLIIESFSYSVRLTVGRRVRQPWLIATVQVAVQQEIERVA